MRLSYSIYKFQSGAMCIILTVGLRRLASRLITVSLDMLVGVQNKGYIVHLTYRTEGNFGSGKIWRIHCINTLAKENLANCEILQVKISRKTYPVKHSERSCRNNEGKL